MSSSTSPKSVCEESALEIFRTNGLLSQCLKRFEVRQEQQDMVRDVVQAYNENEIALIEAGTGTGKRHESIE